jgi:curved DNA-binding protein CbpA
MLKDYYALLGLSPEATGEDIARSFAEKSRSWHPFYHLGSEQEALVAAKFFNEIREAYLILSDPTLRLLYDANRQLAVDD